MPRLITLFVAAYWATFFAILTLAAAGEVTGEGFPVVDKLLSPAGWPFHVSFGAPISSFLAVGFLLVAVLFLWTMATTIFEGGDRRGDGDEVARIALGAATGMMAVLLIVGVGFGIRDVFAAISMQLIALLVSYVAILAEAGRASQRERETRPGPDGTARVMALGAARDSMLSRLSRRDPGPEKRF